MGKKQAKGKKLEGQITDVLIIGGGPAGVSAALYTARGGLKTRIIYKDSGALTKAACIENFYGQAVPPDGETLIQTGLNQARKVGAEVIQAEVVGISLGEHFTVATTDAAYHAKTIVLATGANRGVPDIAGLCAFEGKGVSYCAVCDAFFYRDKNTVVLGTGAYAQQEARVLEPLAKSVTLLEPSAVMEITGEDTVSAIKLKEGSELPVDGVFIAIGVAGGTELAKKLGAETDANGIVVDNDMRTSVPGLWAAGDCTPGIKQIAKAVYDGAAAGMGICREHI
jgi:thioredoxin reductase (NADPH)